MSQDMPSHEKILKHFHSLILGQFFFLTSRQELFFSCQAIGYPGQIAMISNK